MASQLHVLVVANKSPGLFRQKQGRAFRNPMGVYRDQSGKHQTVERERMPSSRIVQAGCSRELPLLRSRSGYLSPQNRSEEHTSELQSLMRISYAVFCLKNKKKLI